MAEGTLHPRPAAAARILGECCVVVRGHAGTFDGGVKWKVPSNARSLQTSKKGEPYLQGRTHANKQKTEQTPERGPGSPVGSSSKTPNDPPCAPPRCGGAPAAVRTHPEHAPGGGRTLGRTSMC